MTTRTLQAFDTRSHRYAPSLRRFLWRRLSHPDQQDDVRHDVLLVAW